jgi:hypothetical protein
VSGQSEGKELELGSVMGASEDGGVAHGARLVAFTDAVMADDAEAIAATRAALRDVLDDAALVDTCAIIGAFNVVDRIADAIGIPLDGMLIAMSGEVRAELDLGAFGSAANTPGAANA